MLLSMLAFLFWTKYVLSINIVSKLRISSPYSEKSLSRKWPRIESLSILSIYFSLIVMAIAIIVFILGSVNKR